jgi:carboxyl-terminal processing protease
MEPVPFESDSVERQVFHTDAGRAVYGGGGIVPDVIVHADTSTLSERELSERLREAEVRLPDLALRFSARLALAGELPADPTAVTPDVRSEFDRFVVIETEGAIDSDDLDLARDPVDGLLAREMARVSAGEIASLRVAIDRSSEVREARRLLAEARTPEALLALAADMSQFTGVEGEGR